MFDPSKLDINPEIFKSFQELMDEKNRDPEMQKMYEEMLKLDPTKLGENSPYKDYVGTAEHDNEELDEESL